MQTDALSIAMKYETWFRECGDNNVKKALLMSGSRLTNEELMAFSGMLQTEIAYRMKGQKPNR